MEQGRLWSTYRFGSCRRHRIDRGRVVVSQFARSAGSGNRTRQSAGGRQHSSDVEILRSHRPGLCGIALARIARCLRSTRRASGGSALISSFDARCCLDTRCYFRDFLACCAYRAGPLWPIPVVTHSCSPGSAGDSSRRSGDDLRRSSIRLLADFLSAAPGPARQRTQHFTSMGIKVSRCSSHFPDR